MFLNTVAHWAEPALVSKSLRRLYYCEGGNLIELRNASGQPHLALTLSFSLSHLSFLSAFFILWKEGGRSSRQGGQCWAGGCWVGGYVCVRRPLEKSWGWGDEGAGFFCVCIHFLGEGSSVIFGRKWRLMIMRTMLLTSPQPQLCACWDRGNVGVGSPFSAQCVLVN